MISVVNINVALQPIDISEVLDINELTTHMYIKFFITILFLIQILVFNHFYAKISMICCKSL